MLRWALIFLVIALVAGLLGFARIAGTAASIAHILFVVFLVLFPGFAGHASGAGPRGLTPRPIHRSSGPGGDAGPFVFHHHLGLRQLGCGGGARGGAPARQGPGPPGLIDAAAPAQGRYFDGSRRDLQHVEAGRRAARAQRQGAGADRIGVARRRTAGPRRTGSGRGRSAPRSTPPSHSILAAAWPRCTSPETGEPSTSTNGWWQPTIRRASAGNAETAPTAARAKCRFTAPLGPVQPRLKTRARC